MIIWRFVATFFYLGKLPFAPGSWGSLGALLLWLLLPVTFSVHLSVIIILFILGVFSSNKMAKYLNNQDVCQPAFHQKWLVSKYFYLVLPSLAALELNRKMLLGCCPQKNLLQIFSPLPQMNGKLLFFEGYTF